MYKNSKMSLIEGRECREIALIEGTMVLSDRLSYRGNFNGWRGLLYDRE